MSTSVCGAPFPGIDAPIGGLKGSIENGVRTSVRNNAAAYGYSVMITASFGVLSAAVGGAALCGELLSSWFAWLAGPLVASATYVIASGVEMALAHAAQERREEREGKGR